MICGGWPGFQEADSPQNEGRPGLPHPATRDLCRGRDVKPSQTGIAPRMKPHDESVAQERLSQAPLPSAGRGNQWTAACAALAFVVFLWTFGTEHPRHSLTVGGRPHAAIAKIWDKQQEATRAVLAIRPTPSRRPPNSPTRIAVPCTTIQLARSGYCTAAERRPVTLSPHLSQIRLRAPPAVLA